MTYTFQNSSGLTAGLDTPNFSHSFCTIYSTDYLTYIDSGSIIFTNVDHNLGLYTGTFSLKLKNENNPNDILEITQGRFDINLATLNK